MRILLICLVIGLFCSAAQAKPRKTYNYSTPTYSNNYTIPNAKTSTYTSLVENGGSGSSDQERCQAEADHMAANNITGHVWSCIGRFEGVGYGSSPSCKTCTPSGNMTPTGDASAQGRNGMWYRVRSWR